MLGRVIYEITGRLETLLFNWQPQKLFYFLLHFPEKTEKLGDLFDNVFLLLELVAAVQWLEVVKLYSLFQHLFRILKFPYFLFQLLILPFYFEFAPSVKRLRYLLRRGVLSQSFQSLDDFGALDALPVTLLLFDVWVFKVVLSWCFLKTARLEIAAAGVFGWGRLRSLLMKTVLYDVDRRSQIVNEVRWTDSALFLVIIVTLIPQLPVVHNFI